MRKMIPTFIAVAVALGGLFFANHFSYTRTVHAQSACDASSLAGAYGYGLSGYIYDAQGNLYFAASAGRLVADGNGVLAGADTVSVDGTIARRKYTGSYSMNGDCTGSMVMQITTDSGSGVAHADIVAVNNAREINFIQTDATFVFSGLLKRQNQ